MMADVGKECRFTLNFDMPWPFTQRKTELLRQMMNSQSQGRIQLKNGCPHIERDGEREARAKRGSGGGAPGKIFRDHALQTVGQRPFSRNIRGTPC